MADRLRPPDGWNYLACRADGDGNLEVVADELPISIGTITDRMSSPSTMSGSIDNEVKRLKANGQPIFKPWNTVIIAEANNIIRGMGIYRKPSFTGASWKMDIAGLPCYLEGLPYVGSRYFIDADPLDIVRECFAHAQGQQNGDYGMTVDQLKTPVRVGEQVENVDFVTGEGERVAFEAGPRKLTWYLTKNLLGEVTGYAKETPFDWHERLYWTGDQPHCHIDLGYPTIGQRDDSGPRFVLGENLATEPTATPDDYFTEVHVLGAGEGRDRIRGYAGTSDSRIRRAKVVEDKTAKSKTRANSIAQRHLAASRGETFVEQIEIVDHPNARIHALQIGNDYPLYAETDWTLIDTYARIVGIATSPGKSNVATLTIARREVV